MRIRGGRADIDAHRRHGGDPDSDVSYQLLAAFFEPDDERLARLAADYREGSLLSGELKEIAATAIADFLEAHQRRRSSVAELADALAPYRLTADERAAARETIGFPSQEPGISSPCG